MMVMSVRATILPPLTVIPNMVIAFMLSIDRVTPIGRTPTQFMTVIMSIMAIVLLLAMIVAIVLLLATIILPPSLRLFMSIKVDCYITRIVMSVRTIIINATLTMVIAARLTIFIRSFRAVYFSCYFFLFILPFYVTIILLQLSFMLRIPKKISPHLLSGFIL